MKPMGQRTPKRTILVLSQHSDDPTVPGVLHVWPYGGMATELAYATAALGISRPMYDHVVFLELHVNVKMTDAEAAAFVNQLGPQIRARQIGRIHGVRDRVPLERPMLGQAGATS